MSLILITPKTGAETTAGIRIETPKSPITFGATGLANPETIYAQWTPDGGVTWHDLYQAGVLVELSDIDCVKTAYGPLTIRWVKSATAGAVGLYLMRDEEI